MATKAQKDEVLFETKQINALKLKRNKYQRGSKYKKALQSIIDVAEDALRKKRNRYGI